MKDLFILLFCSTLFMQRSYAQELPMRISIQEALKMAEQKNNTLLLQQLEIDYARAGIALSKAKYLPQIYADAHLQRNLIIPITPVPAEAFEPTAAKGDIRALRFMTNWMSNAGINASYELFNPQKNKEIQAANLSLELKQVEAKINAKNLTYTIKKSYLEALIAQEQYELAQADSTRKSKIWEISQWQFEEGRLTQIQLNQVNTDRNKGIAHVEEAHNIYLNALAQLLFDIGVSPTELSKIQLSDSIMGLYRDYADQHIMQANTRLANQRKALDLALTTVQIKGLKQAYLPRLSLSSYYGSNYYDNDFKYFKGQSWNGNSFVALHVRLPLFESQDQFKKIKQLQIQERISELEYDDEINKDQLAIQKNQRDTKLYASKMHLSLQNFALAQQNYSLAQHQFEEGRLLLSNLYEANYQYQVEKNNYLQATYQYLAAQIMLENLVQ